MFITIKLFDKENNFSIRTIESERISKHNSKYSSFNNKKKNTLSKKDIKPKILYDSSSKYKDNRARFYNFKIKRKKLPLFNFESTLKRLKFVPAISIRQKFFNYQLFQTFNIKLISSTGYKDKFFEAPISSYYNKNFIKIKTNLLSDFVSSFYKRRIMNSFFNNHTNFDPILYKTYSKPYINSFFKKRIDIRFQKKKYNYFHFKYILKGLKSSYWYFFRFRFSIYKRYDYRRLISNSLYRFLRIYFSIKFIRFCVFKIGFKKSKFGTYFFKFIKKVFSRFKKRKSFIKKKKKIKNWIKKYKRKFSVNSFFFVKRVLASYSLINNHFKLAFSNNFSKSINFSFINVKRPSNFFFRRIFFINNYYAKKNYNLNSTKFRSRRFFFSTFSHNFYKVSKISNFFRGYSFRKLRYIQFFKFFKSFPYYFFKNKYFIPFKFKFFRFFNFFNIKTNFYNLFIRIFSNFYFTFFKKGKISDFYSFFNFYTIIIFKNFFFKLRKSKKKFLSKKKFFFDEPFIFRSNKHYKKFKNSLRFEFKKLIRKKNSFFKIIKIKQKIRRIDSNNFFTNKIFKDDSSTSENYFKKEVIKRISIIFIKNKNRFIKKFLFFYNFFLINIKKNVSFNEIKKFRLFSSFFFKFKKKRRKLIIKKKIKKTKKFKFNKTIPFRSKFNNNRKNFIRSFFKNKLISKNICNAKSNFIKYFKYLTRVSKFYKRKTKSLSLSFKFRNYLYIPYSHSNIIAKPYFPLYKFIPRNIFYYNNSRFFKYFSFSKKNNKIYYSSFISFFRNLYRKQYKFFKRRKNFFWKFKHNFFLADFIRQNNYDSFKKEKNFVSLHHARNNFFIYVHNVNGKIIYQSTNGLAGYHGPKKPTTFAAEMNARKVAKAIKRSNLSPLVLVIRTRLTSFVRSAIKGINYIGVKFNYVRRVILKGHNGLRKPGLRRV